MKNLSLLFWLLLLNTLTLKSQDTTSVLQIADEMPKYLTGDTGLYSFIRQNIQYPQLCLDSGIQGKVYLRFVVGADGQIKKPEVIKGVCSLLNEEALRVVNKMPPFIPAKNGGKNVDAYYAMPISFVLPEKQKNTSEIYQVLSSYDVPPRYKGGDDELKEFLFYNTGLPRDKAGMAVEGQSIVGFIVDSFGYIKDVKALLQGTKELDEEAIRVVKLFPPFTPAQRNNQSVSSYISIKFEFSIFKSTPLLKHQIKNHPTFPGGDDSLLRQIEKEVLVPKGLKKENNAYITLNFEFDTAGRLTMHPQSPNQLANRPIINQQIATIFERLLKTATPAMKDSARIPCYYSIAIRYKIKHRKVIFYYYRPVLANALDEMIYLWPDTIPKYVEGYDSLRHFIQKNAWHPENKKKNKSGTTVYVVVVITPEGRIIEPEIKYRVSKNFDREALSIVKSIPGSFNPAIHNGQAVKSYLYIPVTFKSH